MSTNIHVYMIVSMMYHIYISLYVISSLRIRVVQSQKEQIKNDKITN